LKILRIPVRISRLQPPYLLRKLLKGNIYGRYRIEPSWQLWTLGIIEDEC
jgi:hypothetical protein